MIRAVKNLKHFETPKEAGKYFRLVCLTGKTKGEAYLIVGSRVVLGRSDKADIRVLDIKSSREHCEIAKVGRDFILTDLGSQNGVIVNDLKVRQHVLNEGDKVIIGQTVYKFDQIVVESNSLHVSEELEDINEFPVEEEKQNKLIITLGIVFLVAIFILFDNKKEINVSSKKKAARYNVQELPGSIAESIGRANKSNKKLQKKMNIYFQKGLREFRENNYFRAISEFEHALSWSSNDAQALFYLRKTKEARDKTIKDLILKGKRDEDAFKLQSAIVSYCSVIRLLYRYPNDERYKNVKDSIGKIEEQLGLDKGETECQKEIK